MINLILILVIVVASIMLYLFIKPLISSGATEMDSRLATALEAGGIDSKDAVTGFNNIEKAENTLVFDSIDKFFNNFEKYIEIYFPLIDIKRINTQLQELATKYKNDIPEGTTIGTFQEIIKTRPSGFDMLFNNILFVSILNSLSDPVINNLTWLGLIIFTNLRYSNIKIIYEYENNKLYLYMYNINIQPETLKNKLNELKDKKMDIYKDFIDSITIQQELWSGNTDNVIKFNVEFISIFYAIQILLKSFSSGNIDKIDDLFNNPRKDEIINNLKKSLNEENNKQILMDFLNDNISSILFNSVTNIAIQYPSFVDALSNLTGYALEFQTMDLSK